MYESVLISGHGGQGVLFAGRVLAQAALEAGFFTTYFPSYGAEIRGGTANCTVIVSDSEIGSPIVSKWQNLILLNKQSYNKFKNSAAAGSTFVINSSLVGDAPVSGGAVHAAALSAVSAEELGDVKYANIAALGVFLKFKQLFDLKFAENALRKVLNLKKQLVDINIKALNLGAGYK